MFIKSFRIRKPQLILLILAIFIIVVFLSTLIGSYFISLATDEEEKEYIKWVDFNVTAEAMKLTSKLDIESHNTDAEVKYNWIELLAYLAAQNGGNFKNFKKAPFKGAFICLKDICLYLSIQQILSIVNRV